MRSRIYFYATTAVVAVMSRNEYLIDNNNADAPWIVRSSDDSILSTTPVIYLRKKPVD